MPNSTSTTARCDFCGEPLKAIRIEMFGRPMDVACYGSCGCGLSAERLSRLSPRYESAERRCPMCHGTMRVDARNGLIADCPWCGYSCVFRADVDARNAEARAESARARGGVLAGTGIPELYWDVAPDVARADAIERTGRGLYIYGEGNGTLKTLTACATAKALAERGRSVRFVSSTTMLRDFKDTFGTSRTEGEVYAELVGCDLLVMDDIGKEQPTSWAAAMLYSVIDGRYGKGNWATVVTTNFAEGELAAMIARSSDESTAKAIMSRLFEMTEKVVLDGPDRRVA